MCKLSAYVAFDKATDGQTDMKHEMGKTLSSMSLMEIVGEKLPPSQRSSLETGFFVEDPQPLRAILFLTDTSDCFSKGSFVYFPTGRLLTNTGRCISVEPNNNMCIGIIRRVYGRAIKWTIKEARYNVMLRLPQNVTVGILRVKYSVQLNAVWFEH